MKTALNLLLLVITLSSWAQELPRLKVNGNQIIDDSGKQYVFQGLNTSDPDKLEKDGKWTRAYFEEIKDWGANLVRFPIHPPRVRDLGLDNYLKLLDQGIQWAGELGMYVILDWHVIGNLKSEMFFLPIYETSKKETLDFWRTMAVRYADNTTVAFFELFNEPTVYGGRLGISSWEDHKLLMEELITIIRANGAEAIPLVAGFNWAYDLTPIADNPIDREGIAYVSHPYPQKREKPWEAKWTKDWGFVAENYPVLLTEIGFCGPDDPGAHIPVISNESYGDALTSYCQEKGISYVVWVFDPDWSPMLFSDWDYTPTRQGKYFKEAMRK